MTSNLRSTPCERRQLAAGNFAMLELCTCGSVHVTIGAVTLRIHAEALPELAAVFGDGARELTLQHLIAEHQALVSKVMS